MLSKHGSIQSTYMQVTRADGTVEPKKLIARTITHPNPIKAALLRWKYRKATD